jgi:hypothetical protein
MTVEVGCTYIVQMNRKRAYVSTYLQIRVTRTHVSRFILFSLTSTVGQCGRVITTVTSILHEEVMKWAINEF